MPTIHFWLSRSPCLFACVEQHESVVHGSWYGGRCERVYCHHASWVPSPAATAGCFTVFA